MNIYNAIIYFSFSVIFFLIQNWIGSKSYSIGYIRFSFLDDKDEALSLNFMVKVLGPTIYLIIIAALIQYFSFDINLNCLIWIIYFYLFLRVLVIIIYQRLRIVNWFRILFQYTTIILLALIIQSKFISTPQTLLPDFQEVKNEIWLLILIFLYQMGNNQGKVPEKSPDQERGLAYLPELLPRKKKYILRNYQNLQNRYAKIISENSNNNIQLNIVIYSILIYENFNRPFIIRKIENLWFLIRKKPGTFGIMQIKNDKLITDIESVRLGSIALNDELLKLEDDANYESFLYIIKYHCPDRKYIRQILFIAKAIIENTYSKEDIDKQLKELYRQISNEFGLVFYY